MIINPELCNNDCSVCCCHLGGRGFINLDPLSKAASYHDDTWRGVDQSPASRPIACVRCHNRHVSRWQLAARRRGCLPGTLVVRSRRSSRQTKIMAKICEISVQRIEYRGASPSVSALGWGGLLLSSGRCPWPDYRWESDVRRGRCQVIEK